MKYNTGVYLIENIKNGIVYIGSSKHMKKRWIAHESSLNRGLHHNYKLQKDWIYYGPENFKFHPILYFSIEHQIFYEKMLLDNIYEKYNICKTPHGFNGQPKSQETRLKISKAVSGRVVSEATRAKLSIAQLGKSHSPETRRKFSAIHKGRAKTKEEKEKVRASRAGKYEGPTHHASKTIVCIENGMEFANARLAVIWLISKGFEKAAKSPLCNVCNGKNKSAYGFHWSYIKD